MAKLRCPIITCNVEHMGQIWVITPMVLMHLSGSHQLDMTEEDVVSIVSWQADPETQNKPWPKLYPEKKEDKPRRVVKDKDAVKDWWNSIDK